MSRKPKSWESAMLNDQTYLMYYYRLRDYALSLFEWKGLPDSINERFLEVTLYEQGKAVFFNDESLGYLGLPVMLGYALNVYQEPTSYQAITSTYQKELTPDNAVIIWGNNSRSNVQSVLQMFARRLYKVERAMDINIEATKTPILLLADETQRLTLLNAYNQYQGDQPFIFGNRSGFDKESFQVLKTDAPFYTDKLMEYKHNLWNEAMTYLGIGNAKQDKRERLVSDEVAANDQQIESSRFIWLNARQRACEEINKMFGLNISVDFRLNVLQQQQQKEAETEVIDNGSN